MKRERIALLAFLLLAVLLGTVYAQSVVRLGSPARELQIAERAYLAYSPRAYTGTGSFQPVGIDLNLAAAAGGTTGKFIAPMMGNVFGTNLTKAGNYIGGGIFHYNIAGTNATTYPSGAVLAGIGDGTVSARCAVCGYIDGDSAQTNVNAIFGVDNLNSVPGSGPNYGMSLYRAAHDGYDAFRPLVADIQFNSQATLSLLSATASLDFAQASANTCEVLTITVTNAADGNPVSVGVPQALANHNLTATVFSWVSSAGVVSVRRCVIDADGTNPAAATVRATVLKP